MLLCLEYILFLASVSESPFASSLSIDTLCPCVVGRMDPKDAHILIPGNCDNVTLHSKKVFEAMIKDEDLESGRLF